MGLDNFKDIAIGKLFIVSGLLFIIIGVFWQYGLFKTIRLGKLPGDISIEKENFKFYFPITTCILLSLILSALVALVQKLK